MLGESGSGKTETTKQISKFLCATAHKDLMEILNDAGPILEAFGNAVTLNNTNSSRYCKFFEVCYPLKSNFITNFILFYFHFSKIHYGSKLEVIGGIVRHFMLEKCRILQYHIFRHILKAPEDIKKHLKLDDVSSICQQRCTSQPKSLHIIPQLINFQPIFDDTQNNVDVNVPGSLEDLDKSFDKIFPQQQKYQLYQFIAGIYCLSKVYFQQSVVGCVLLPESERALKLAANFLKLEQEELADALLNRTIQPIGENQEKITYVY